MKTQVINNIPQPHNYQVTSLKGYDINSSIFFRISSAVLNALKFIASLYYEAKTLIERDLKYDKSSYNQLTFNKRHLVKQVSEHQNLGRALIEFAKYYIDISNASIIDNPTEDNLRTELQANKIVTIPVITKSFFKDHISTLRIDPREQRIVFYDPKGKTLKEIANCDLKVNLESFKVKELWQRIQKVITSLPSWHLLENTHRYQKDRHNCGVHFYHAAIKPEQLPDPIEQSQIIQKRKELLEDILH